MDSVQRRRYDPDFKRNAVRLTEEPGRSVKGIADNLGISTDILYRWRSDQRAGKEAQRRRDGARYPEKSCGNLQQSTEMKYRFMKENRSSFPVKKMCQALEVAQSGFYRLEKAPVSKRQQENNRIKERVKEIFSAHKGIVGSPLVTADLRDEDKLSKVSRPRVARILRQAGGRAFVVQLNSGVF